MGWIFESSDGHKIKLSRQELSQFTSFIYKESVEKPLSYKETRYLAEMAVQFRRIISQ